MNIPRILEELEAMFETHDIKATEEYLTKRLEQAYAEPDYGACITLLNEMIGFLRDTSQYQKGLDYSEQLLMLMQQMGYEGTLPYATTCLNVANLLRAAGHHKEAMSFYERVLEIYQRELPKEDARFVAFYNNLSLLYQEMDDYESAAACLMEALKIVSKGDDIIKVAITHSNLGASLLKLGRTTQAVSHLEKALAIYNRFEQKDFHYNAALAAMGQAYVALGRLREARDCYLEALYEQQKHCGKSEAFYRILDNLHIVEEALGIPLTSPDTQEVQQPHRNTPMTRQNMQQTEYQKVQRANQGAQEAHISGLQLSEDYLWNVALKSLQEQFGAFMGHMAIGLAGEGSECFGFDDAISTDHDFGPGFCIWLAEEYYALIGERLQKWYDALPKSYKGYTRRQVNGKDRVGVLSMQDFIHHFTGLHSASEAKETDVLYRFTDENMAALCNGRIFYDPSGMFIEERKAFRALYTEKIWRTKIAGSLIQLGKYGQYNYARAMKRGDYVTAQITLYKYVEELLKLVHYVNHSFPPYYKWLKKSAAKQEKLAVLADLTEALADFAAEPEGAGKEKILGTIEIIAGLIIEEGRNAGWLDGISLPKEELFLEAYGKQMLECQRSEHKPTAPENKQVMPKRKKEKADMTEQKFEYDYERLYNMTHEELVEHMISLEWNAFDKVQNLGGRADCQDDWGTFSIMRKSQYLTWPKELLICYIQDFHAANSHHWNLITEKYARMMQTTDPATYEELAENLPEVTETQLRIVEQLVEIQVGWMEEFAGKYPNMAANSRSIHTSEDTPFNTSYETYLRGELLTYSPKTLKTYAGFIIRLAENNQNLAEIIMTNTALLYGYDSLEQAEKKLGYQ